ncbi:MAG: (Fe-S)-binding protein [bacterium]
MIPTREVFWNIKGHNWLYLIAVIGVVSFLVGITRRILLWNKGKPLNRSNNIIKRTLDTLIQILIASKQYYRRGFFHLMIFWGFSILFVGTVLVASHEYLDLKTMSGNFYIGMSFTLDLFGLILIIGILLALFRRYILLPEGLDRKVEDLLTPLILLLVVISGFLIEALRISVDMPAFERWSFIGWFIAKHLSNLPKNTIITLHIYLWWIHAFISFLFIGLLPYLKVSHIFYAPISIFTRSYEPKGAIKPIENIEEQETFGVTTLTDFTWKDLLDLDACVRCGRCQEVCPAFLSSKPLSPKKFIQDMKLKLNKLNKEIKKDINTAIMSDAVLADELWSCTTCYACQEFCPIFVEHIRKVIDLRRSEVLNESRFPHELTLTFKNIETNYNPWGIGFAERDRWAEGLDIKRFEKEGDAEYLLFVGCMGSYDEKAIKTMKALVNILHNIGIDFAVLGNEELCCGDSPRRLGNEYLFQTLAMENIDKFNDRGISKIITACPHGYNTIKNEYPQFGYECEIYHHTQIISKAIKEGKLKLEKIDNNDRVIYHDSCYLSRYNNIFKEPRFILREIYKNIIEADRNKNKSFCCGAGGGRMWMEETIGKRINEIRFDELMKRNPDKIVTACSFCLTMLTDGKKARAPEIDVQIKDIVELVYEAYKI